MRERLLRGRAGAAGGAVGTVAGHPLDRPAV